MRPGSLVHAWHGRGHRRVLVSLCAGSIMVAALLVPVVSLALAATPTFADVPATHPYYTAISDLASRGIVGGYGNGNFGPTDLVMRQQFAKMIVLTMGHDVPANTVCPFTDVDLTPSPADPLYPARYVAVCALHGITQGKTPTTFAPYALITRFQVLSMVVRAIDEINPGLLAAVPGDFQPAWDPNLSPQHGGNAVRAEYNGLLAGIDLTGLDPLGNMSRGEIAQVLHNVLVKLAVATTTTEAATTSSSTIPSPTTTTTACPP